jgi:hypothetical protein
MFKSYADLTKYVRENFPEVTDHRMDKEHWDLPCAACKVTRGFQLVSRAIQHHRSSYHGAYGMVDRLSPVTYHFRCPVCSSFKLWILYELTFKIKKQDDEQVDTTRYFRITSLPSEGLEDINELPEKPPELRTAYRQAIRAMDANAHIAAAAMFRRAVQVITRNLLGAKPGNLANELQEVVGKTYNGVTVTANFANVGYIVKEAGNQGAHPDKDPDLLDFTAQDAQDLQAIFMELVSELFVIPEATQRKRIFWRGERLLQNHRSRC